MYQYYKSEKRHLRSFTVSKRCILYIFCKGILLLSTYSDSEVDGSVHLFPLKTRDGDLTDDEESLDDSYCCRSFFLYILKMFDKYFLAIQGFEIQESRLP